uniref:RING-type domain-containing protein n=1 Tax=Acanthochromis polyacanthus TaxID=80966 RepID=A0A3Q1GDU4_9TELE
MCVFTQEQVEQSSTVSAAEETCSGCVPVSHFWYVTRGNISMESHAVRALVRLYQRTVTSPMSLRDRHGATGISRSLKNSSSDYQSERASNDETCPICMDVFIKKQQLKCKHAFCKRCLQQAEKSIGPTCPVCKDVFVKHHQYKIKLFLFTSENPRTLRSSTLN